jgi:hypothetical protein
MVRTAARAWVACATVLAICCALASSTTSCSRTLLLTDVNDGGPGIDSSGDVDDGSPLEPSGDSGDSTLPLEASEDSGAQDVTMLDAEVDSTTTLDALPETSPERDAQNDVQDAAADVAAEAGCGAVGESCCQPGSTCASGLDCDGTTLLCICLYETCGDQCVDEYSDKNNCGACGNACTFSEVCGAGQCGCPYNWTLCSGGACIDTRTDPANCGACGVSCQSVTGDPSAQCVLGGCRTMSVVASGTRYYGLTVDDTAVYYSTATTVEALPKAGGPAIVLASGLSAPATWLVVDSTSLYWGSFGSLSGSVYSCALTGCAGAPTALTTITSPVVDMVLDSTTLYWATRYDLQSCPKTGGGAPTSLATNVYPSYLVVDAQNVYWSGNGNAISMCPLSGCTSTPALLVTNAGLGLFLDGTSLYWAGGPGVLGCVLPDCVGTQVTIATTGMYSAGELLGDATNLYWSMPNTDYLGRAPRSGGNVTAMAYADTTAMALDAAYLYWVDSIGGGAIFRTPK